MDRHTLHSFMTRHRYGVVASLSANGVPQSALIGIAVSRDLEIVFDTLTSSRKYANLIARPRCSVVVGWSGEQTVQLEGTAVALQGGDLERCQQVYFDVWPDGKERMHSPGIAYFAVRPEWVRYSDYEQAPPWIEELSFGERQS